MNPAVIPLVAAGGRGDRARLLGMVAGVMVGVALFLLLWGAYQALQLREERTAWLQFGGVDATYVADLESGPAADAVVARLGTDHVADAAIQRVDVSAPTGDPAGTPQIPGLDGLPPVGAYAASPLSPPSSHRRRGTSWATASASRSASSTRDRCRRPMRSWSSWAPTATLSSPTRPPSRSRRSRASPTAAAPTTRSSR
nr:hypothetical protein GCM10025699_70200 [Microbacterium flavescens]